MERKAFFKLIFLSAFSIFLPKSLTAKNSSPEESPVQDENYNAYDHKWGMCIDIDKCIGCGRCANACKEENDVPREPFFFRTWVERYKIFGKGEVVIDSPNGGVDGFHNEHSERNPERSFFVPKLCNHCENPPCTQVCPVGATFKSVDGVILVDKDYCIGCSYCIQACPYGARYLHPVTKTAEKCTFCYHRLVNDKSPACVEVCPTQARIFGEMEKKSSPLVRFRRMEKIGVLKPALNTEPKVLYAHLDMEVK
ncbi:MAG: 4Fe-4S dicluster domain-containing protein [Bacteroidetes bacterium]|nr:4Fe-4S dicluster domain-containing protein [Bacteroidota bacterium]